MLFWINIEFMRLKLQTHISQDVLFIDYNNFLQVMVICLHLIKNVALGFRSINDIFNFQEMLKSLLSSTNFYSKSEIVEGCHKM